MVRHGLPGTGGAEQTSGGHPTRRSRRRWKKKKVEGEGCRKKRRPGAGDGNGRHVVPRLRGPGSGGPRFELSDQGPLPGRVHFCSAQKHPPFVLVLPARKTGLGYGRLFFFFFSFLVGWCRSPGRPVNHWPAYPSAPLSGSCFAKNSRTPLAPGSKDLLEESGKSGRTGPRPPKAGGDPAGQ